MDLASKSTVRAIGLAERAARLAFELAPEIQRHWRNLDDEVGTPEADRLDFGDACRRIGVVLRSLQAQLLLAAITAELSPSQPEARVQVLTLQQRLTAWLRRLRDLFLLSRHDQAADSIDPRTSFFRPIAGLLSEGKRPQKKGGLLAVLTGLTPKDLLEARLGMLAISNFPQRPASPQQLRRKKRRRRRSSPGAPSASLRRNRGGDDEED